MALFNFTTIIVFISFAVFMFLMRAIFFEPMTQIREAREQKMEEDKKAINDSQTSTVSVQDEYEQLLKDAHRKSTELINESRQKATKEASETISASKEDARKQLEEETNKLNVWREESYQSLSSERDSLKKIIIDKITQPKAVKVTTG